MLQVHTVRSNERWRGHPSIPPRVFGLAEYLDDLPKHLTKPQTTIRPLLNNNNGSTPDAQQSSSQTGSFEATRSHCERSFPKLKEQSSGQKFAVWFDSTFADWSAKLKQRAIQASLEAATRILFKALRGSEKSVSRPEHLQPEAAHGCQPTRMGYKPETQDICYLRE